MARRLHLLQPDGDEQFAKRFKRDLEGFAKGLVQLRAVRVFLDDSSLDANPDLWKAIAQAIDKSAFFILLASPQAARSEWVNRELFHFLNGSPRPWCIVLTAGSLPWLRARSEDVHNAGELAISDRLQEHLKAQKQVPRIVDMRAFRDAKLTRDGRRAYLHEIASVSAAVRSEEKTRSTASTSHSGGGSLPRSPG
jgi:hypothetical protein